MRIAYINVVAGYGSTGRLIDALSEMDGVTAKVYFGRKQNLSKIDTYRITGFTGNINHAVQTFLFDNQALCNTAETKRMIEDLKAFQPDLIHLHNLHGYYLNITVLFDFLRQISVPVVWTLHDCWAFTGHCAHYEAVGCNQWKTECIHCPQLNQYPITWNGSNVKRNYDLKKELFTSLGSRLHLATPSQWLYDQVKMSFLGNIDCRVISNGINLNIFRPQESDFRNQYHIGARKLIVACASIWTERKGLRHLIELSEQMPESTVLCVVGLARKQKKLFNNNVICIERTDSVQQLAEIYSSADLFVNPTLEETFSLVNVESQACGCPVATFRSGGSTEMISGKSGIVVNDNSTEGLLDAVFGISEGRYCFDRNCCIVNAKRFSLENMYDGYIKLYQGILEGKL